ncbi:hypothetical protein GCM10009837_37610 [Streptomyces durmitorensis]
MRPPLPGGRERGGGGALGADPGQFEARVGEHPGEFLGGGVVGERAQREEVRRGPQKGTTHASATARPACAVAITRPTCAAATARPACAVATARPTYAIATAPPTHTIATARPAYTAAIARPTYAVAIARPTCAIATARPTHTIATAPPTHAIATGADPEEGIFRPVHMEPARTQRVGDAEQRGVQGGRRVQEGRRAGVELVEVGDQLPAGTRRGGHGP